MADATEQEAPEENVDPEILEKRRKVMEWLQEYIPFDRMFHEVLRQPGPPPDDMEAHRKWVKYKCELSDQQIEYLRELKAIVPEAVQFHYGLAMPIINGANPPDTIDLENFPKDYSRIGGTSTDFGYLREVIFGGTLPPEFDELFAVYDELSGGG